MAQSSAAESEEQRQRPAGQAAASRGQVPSGCIVDTNPTDSMRAALVASINERLQHFLEVLGQPLLASLQAALQPGAAVQPGAPALARHCSVELRLLTQLLMTPQLLPLKRQALVRWLLDRRYPQVLVRLLLSPLAALDPASSQQDMLRAAAVADEDSNLQQAAALAMYVFLVVPSAQGYSGNNDMCLALLRDSQSMTLLVQYVVYHADTDIGATAEFINHQPPGVIAGTALRMLVQLHAAGDPSLPARQPLSILVHSPDASDPCTFRYTFDGSVMEVSADLAPRAQTAVVRYMSNNNKDLQYPPLREQLARRELGCAELIAAAPRAWQTAALRGGYRWPEGLPQPRSLAKAGGLPEAQQLAPSLSSGSAQAAAADEATRRACDACGASGPDVKLKRCAGCKRVRYCSAACQRRAWRGHRSHCQLA